MKATKQSVPTDSLSSLILLNKTFIHSVTMFTTKMQPHRNDFGRGHWQITKKRRKKSGVCVWGGGGGGEKRLTNGKGTCAPGPHGLE